MEKFSKKRRRKRGRPRTYLKRDYDLAAGVLTGLTLRSQQNGVCVHRAAFVLGILEQQLKRQGVSIDWLYNHKTGRLRRTILAGIGRLSPEDVGLCVYAICRDRLKTNSALKLIRWFRNGKPGLVTPG